MDIAMPLLIITFGRVRVDEKGPYRATLRDGIWCVSGTLPPGWRGGTPQACIRASDGKVLEVSHGR